MKPVIVLDFGPEVGQCRIHPTLLQAWILGVILHVKVR